MSAPPNELDRHLSSQEQTMGAELAERFTGAVDHDPVATPDWADVARHRAIASTRRPARHQRLHQVAAVAAAAVIVVGGLVATRRDDSTVATIPGSSVATIPGSTVPTTTAPDVGFTPLRLAPTSGATLQHAGRDAPPFQPASMATDLDRSVVYRSDDDPFTTPSLLVSIAPWEAEWGFAGSPDTPPNATIGGHPALVPAGQGGRNEVRLHVGDHLIHGRATSLTLAQVEAAMASVVVEDNIPRLLRPPAGLTGHPAWLRPERQRVGQSHSYTLPGDAATTGIGMVNLWVLPDEPGGLDTALQFVLDEGLGQPEGPTVERATAQGFPAVRSWRPINGGFVATVAWRDPDRRAVVLLSASVPSLERMDALVKAVVELDDDGRREIKARCDARPPGPDLAKGPPQTDGLGCSGVPVHTVR